MGCYVIQKSHISEILEKFGKDTGQALGKAPDLDAGTVTELHRWCFDGSGPRRPWSVAELAAVW